MEDYSRKKFFEKLDKIFPYDCPEKRLSQFAFDRYPDVLTIKEIVDHLGLSIEETTEVVARCYRNCWLAPNSRGFVCHSGWMTDRILK